MRKKLKTCSVIGGLYVKKKAGYDGSSPECCEKLKKTLMELLHEGYRHFICRMCLGAEMDFAEIIAEYKEEYPDIFLETVEYEEEWIPPKNGEREVRQSLIVEGFADKVTVLPMEKKGRKLESQTKYMVKKADLLLGFYKEEDEMHCSMQMLYAQKRKKLTRWVRVGV